MAKTNLEIIGSFFEAYGKRDMEGISQVMSEKAQWIFPGQNPLSGVKKGITEIVAFFDAMGSIMGKSNIKVESLITGENSRYIVECQHICTNREDGINLDHHWCVLWTFENGKIASGRHFSSEQQDADKFFNHVS